MFVSLTALLNRNSKNISLFSVACWLLSLLVAYLLFFAGFCSAFVVYVFDLSLVVVASFWCLLFIFCFRWPEQLVDDNNNTKHSLKTNNVSRNSNHSSYNNANADDNTTKTNMSINIIQQQ